MVKFVGAYQLPSPIALTPSCLSKSFRTRIAGRNVLLKTPSVTWSHDNEPKLVSPDVEYLPTRRGQGMHSSLGPTWEHGVPWGVIALWSPGGRTYAAAWVNCVAVEFTLPDGSFDYLDAIGRLGPPHGGTVAVVFETVDSWFLDLLAWVGVVRDHDTDHLEPLPMTSVPGQGLTIRSVESDGRLSTPVTASSVWVTQSRSEAVNLVTLRGLLRLVNKGIRPHESHLLLREAHIARRRHRWRRAVIDAGTASELVLAEWNIHSNGNKQPPPGRFKTLGWYIREAKAIVPTNTMADLVKVRNDAVHNNLNPTPAQAIEALKIAGTIIHSIEPLSL